MIQFDSRKLKVIENEQPLVSIIIATYNAADVLKGAIDSVIANAGENIELIIIDGGSIDDTISILQQYNSNVTTWKSEPDDGIYDALNKGTRLATGKWLYFIGADDRILAGFKEMKKLLKNSDTLYYGNVLTDGPLFLGEFSKYRLSKYCINHQTIFYPESVFKKYSYDTRYKVLADYALNIACWGDDTIKKKYYAVDISFYSTKGFSSKTVDELFNKEKLILIKKYMGWFIYQRFLYKKKKEAGKLKSVFNIVNP